MQPPRHSTRHLFLSSKSSIIHATTYVNLQHILQRPSRMKMAKRSAKHIRSPSFQPKLSKRRQPKSCVNAYLCTCHLQALCRMPMSNSKFATQSYEFYAVKPKHTYQTASPSSLSSTAFRMNAYALAMQAADGEAVAAPARSASISPS